MLRLFANIDNNFNTLFLILDGVLIRSCFVDLDVRGQAQCKADPDCVICPTKDCNNLARGGAGIIKISSFLFAAILLALWAA